MLVGVAHAQDAGDVCRAGMRLLSENQPAAAIESLERCVALRPGVAQEWHALGVAAATLGDYERAERPFRTACELQPGLPDACLYYGRTLYLLNRFQPAIEVLRRALKADSNNSQIYRLVALSWEGLGQMAEARAAFEKAMELNRGSAANEDPGIDYGVFLFRQGHAEQAIAPLENALKRHPEASRAHLELGCVLLALDRLPEAEAHLERAVQLDPQSARSHLLLGKVYLRLGKQEAGEREMRQGSLTAR